LTVFELPSSESRCDVEGTVQEIERTESSKGYEVLLPVAVGGVFLVVLIVGALVG